MGEEVVELVGVEGFVVLEVEVEVGEVEVVEVLVVLGDFSADSNASSGHGGSVSVW